MNHAQRGIFNDPKLTAAEKNAALFKLTTAFHPLSHNFTINRNPSKPIPRATGAMRSA